MLEAYGLTDPGCVRKNNEDYFLIQPDLGLYLVADGMGGARAGELASQLAAETVSEFVKGGGPPSAQLLANAFSEANRKVLAHASSDSASEGMGTTLVALLECGDKLELTSVGDSRCYVFTDRILSLKTIDQSWIEEVGKKLGISEQHLRVHPMRHVLTMAIGASRSLRVHSYTLDRTPGAQYLLSSDGLHGVVSEEIIAGTLAGERTLEDKCHYLIEAARGAGGPDNITAVLVRA